MNDAMSMGIHRVWKDIFIERLGPQHGMRLLDMAGGTGDISFRYLKYLAKQPNLKQRNSHVTISDINQHMLNVGEERARQQGLTADRLPNTSIDWQCADAEKLPFKKDSFTAYTIAFGIRNCTHVDKVRSGHPVNVRFGWHFSFPIPHISGAPRGVSRATAWWPLHVPGIQPFGERGHAVALRSILLSSDTAHGSDTRRPVACVSVSCREYTTLSTPGSLQADDRTSRFRERCLRESDLRCRQHSLRLQAVDDRQIGSHHRPVEILPSA